jgi:predicted RNA-binding Zn ribbon-like protein
VDALSLDFMNSDHRDYRGSGQRTNRLRDDAWRTAFLERWSLEVDVQPTPQALEALEALRGVLWRIAEALDEGREPAGEEIAELNDALAASPVVPRVARDGDGYRLELVTTKRDWAWVGSAIATSFAELLAEHDPARIKICKNADCHWVFYDESKSRTRRWCDDACGNLLKVRRFRARERAAKRGGRS